MEDISIRFEFKFTGTTQEYTGLMIRLTRETKKLTISELAVKVGVTAKVMGMMEMGQRAIPQSKLQKICQELNCKSSDVLPF